MEGRIAAVRRASRSLPLICWRAAARWVDRSAFGKEDGFGQAHQALLKALDKAAVFV
jgi:hypothetical protein